MLPPISNVQKLAGMLILRDPAAIPELRGMAKKLNDLADALEMEANASSPVAQGFIEPGGIRDRCRIAVIGPDGNTTQVTDTNGSVV